MLCRRLSHAIAPAFIFGDFDIETAVANVEDANGSFTDSDLTADSVIVGRGLIDATSSTDTDHVLAFDNATMAVTGGFNGRRRKVDLA